MTGRTLISHWRMDDADIVQDVGWKGNGYDLTGVGLVASTDLVNGIAGGRAIEFNGSDEYLRRVVANWQSGDSSGSITAWVKRATLGSSSNIFSSSDTGGPNYFFMWRFNSSNRIAIIQKNNDTTDQIEGSTAILADEWHHVAVVSTGSAYLLYVNGVLESLTVVTGANTGDWLADTLNRDNIALGVLGQSTPIQYFGGVLDEVQYYDAPLTNLQVRDLFEMQKQGKL